MASWFLAQNPRTGNGKIPPDPAGLFIEGGEVIKLLTVGSLVLILGVRMRIPGPIAVPGGATPSVDVAVLAQPTAPCQYKQYAASYDKDACSECMPWRNYRSFARLGLYVPTVLIFKPVSSRNRPQSSC